MLRPLRFLLLSLSFISSFWQFCTSSWSRFLFVQLRGYLFSFLFCMVRVGEEEATTRSWLEGKRGFWFLPSFLLLSVAVAWTVEPASNRLLSSSSDMFSLAGCFWMNWKNVDTLCILRTRVYVLLVWCSRVYMFLPFCFGLLFSFRFLFFLLYGKKKKVMKI